MIKTLSISNFKGIKKLTLNLKKINIFVGGNNTGKSTILDSILTLYYPYTYKLRSKISHPLIYNLYQGTTEATIKAIFDQEQVDLQKFVYSDSKKTSEYILTITSKKEKIQELLLSNEDIQQFKEKRVETLLTREFYKLKKKKLIDKEYHPDWDVQFALLDSIRNEKFKVNTKYELLDFISNEKFKANTEIEDIIKKNLVFQWNYPEGTFFGIPNVSYFKKIYRIRPNLFIIPRFPFNNDRFEYLSKYSEEKILKKYQDLLRKNMLNTIIQTIQQNIADFVDINELKKDLIVSIGDKKNPLKIPFNLMGEGYQSLIKIIFALSQKDKIFLLEEPEYCLHRGYIEYLTKIILQNIQTNQFIITTHNLEFLESIIEQVKNSKLQDIFQIIRMHNIDGEIDCEILDFSEIEKEMNKLKIDLRGY